MISDGFVTVTCDKCYSQEDVELTPLAGGGWDERNVQRHMERLGWATDHNGFEHVCDACLEDEDDSDD